MESAPSGRNAAIAVIMLAICTLAVGFMPNIAKLAFAEGTNPATLMVIRSAVGIAVFGAIIAASGGPFRVPLAIVALAALAAANAFFNFTYMSSILYIDIGLATLILFTHPYLVAFYFHFSGGTRLSGLQALWSAMAFAGLGLALTIDFGRIDTVGLIHACLATAFCTVMILALVRVNKEIGGLVTCFYMSLGGFVIFAAATPFTSPFAWPLSAFGWWAAAGVGVAFAATYFTWLIAVRLIGGARATLLTFAEPIATIIIAAIMFGERLTLLQWAGVCLVALGLFLLEALPGRRTVAASNA
jgi:drug/metabolite transporter (DMT)-like permease